MRWRAAVAATLLAVLPSSSALGDGLSSAPYRYVNPPPFLKNSNLPPQAVSQTVSFSNTNPFVFTDDQQAALSTTQGGFGHPPGQSGVHITIYPMHSYPTLPETSIQIPGTKTQSNLTLDGNVYGFTAQYVPSKQAVQPTKAVTITLEYPHTPYEMLALHGNAWRVICTQNHLTLTPSTAECNEKAVARAAALLYLPFGGKGVRIPTRTATKAGIPWLIVIPSVIAVVLIFLLLGWVLVSRQRPA